MNKGQEARLMNTVQCPICSLLLEGDFEDTDEVKCPSCLATFVPSRIRKKVTVGIPVRAPAHSAPRRQPKSPPNRRDVPSIPTHLTGAILTTLVCCLPFGLVAIGYASSVSSKLAVGDIAGAQEASDKAETWMWISFALGLISTVFIGAMSMAR